MIDKKILAIDYGTKRVGLAVNYLSLAEPYGILQHSDQLIFDIQSIVTKEGIEHILVGVSDKQMAQESKKFGEEIRKKMALPIEFVDETLTSKTVEEKLRTGSARLKTRMGPIDHYAAAEFLQEWLDSQSES